MPMTNPRIKALIAAAVLLALLLGAVSAQGLERHITIRVGEFYFQVDGQEANAPIELDAVMPHRVTIVNEGTMLHRVKLGRGVVVEEGVPFAYHEVLFDAVPLRVTGTTAEGAAFRIDTTYLTQLDLAPGASIEIAFTLPSTTRGDWEIGCFIPGHYEAGHHAPISVR